MHKRGIIASLGAAILVVGAAVTAPNINTGLPTIDEAQLLALAKADRATVVLMTSQPCTLLSCGSVERLFVHSAAKYGDLHIVKFRYHSPSSGQKVVLIVPTPYGGQSTYAPDTFEPTAQNIDKVMQDFVELDNLWAKRNALVQPLLDREHQLRAKATAQSNVLDDQMRQLQAKKAGATDDESKKLDEQILELSVRETKVWDDTFKQTNPLLDQRLKIQEPILGEILKVQDDLDKMVGNTKADPSK
jgi:hypothetical protein